MALAELQAKRKIPDRLPRTEISPAGYGFSVFAHTLEGLTLKPRQLLTPPALSQDHNRK